MGEGGARPPGSARPPQTRLPHNASIIRMDCLAPSPRAARLLALSRTGSAAKREARPRATEDAARGRQDCPDATATWSGLLLLLLLLVLQRALERVAQLLLAAQLLRGLEQRALVV